MELHPVFTIISFSWPLYQLLFQSEQKLSESVSHLKNPFITVTLLIHFCGPFVAVTGIYYVVDVMLLQKRNEFHEQEKLLLTYTSHGHVFLTVCCSDELQRVEYVSPLNWLLTGGNMNWFSIISKTNFPHHLSLPRRRSQACHAFLRVTGLRMPAWEAIITSDFF